LENGSFGLRLRDKGSFGRGGSRCLKGGERERGKEVGGNLSQVKG
jgi:hypothetical protein